MSAAMTVTAKCRIFCGNSDRNRSRDSLDVLHVIERLVPGTRYRVDTKVKKLVAVDGTKGRGFGAGSIHRIENGPKDAQRILVQVKPETP